MDALSLLRPSNERRGEIDRISAQMEDVIGDIRHTKRRLEAAQLESNDGRLDDAISAMNSMKKRGSYEPSSASEVETFSKHAGRVYDQLEKLRSDYPQLAPGLFLQGWVKRHRAEDGGVLSWCSVM